MVPAPDRSSALFRRLLAAAGYQLEDRPLGLRALRRTDRRALLVARGAPSPGEVVADLPPDYVRRTAVYEDDPGPEVRAAAAGLGLEVLGPDTLGSALGELLLPGPGDDRTLATRADTVPLGSPILVYPGRERTIRPRLGRAEAERLAGVEGFRLTLRLVPFYIFPYRVRIIAAHGGSGPISDHVAAVSGLSGQVEFWENREPDLVAELPEPHQRLDPTLAEAGARHRAEEAIRLRHTVSVDHTEQHGGALIIERRRVPPGPADVQVGSAVLWHVPFWYVEGPEGRVVLDAVTGLRGSPTELALL